MYIKILILLLFSFSAFAQLTPVTDVESFRQRLSVENRQFTSIECDFEQQNHLTIMDEPLVSSGKFYFRHDDMVRLDYTKPRPYLIVLNGQKVKMVSDAKNSVYDMSSNQMATVMKSMLTSCLFGDFSGVGKDYRLLVFEDNSVYHVAIEPISRNMRRYIQKIEITFDKNNLSVNQLIVREPSGDYTTHIFTNKQFNNTLPDKLFDLL